MTTIRNACRVAGALITAAALSACAAPQWENPELNAREAQKAAYACDRDFNMVAMGNPITAGLQYGDCMRANGFVRVK
jgi:predicted phage tail protein